MRPSGKSQIGGQSRNWNQQASQPNSGNDQIQAGLPRGLSRSPERSLSKTNQPFAPVFPHHANPPSPLCLLGFLPKQPQRTNACMKNKVQRHTVRISVSLLLPPILSPTPVQLIYAEWKLCRSGDVLYSAYLQFDSVLSLLLNKTN